jgi:DNA polymerase III gamma/tau subunit
MDLTTKHRPRTFKQVVGQPTAVAVMDRWVKTESVPHCILMTGPSGVGKTTLAHVLKTKIGVGPLDFVAINTADFRGIDAAREIVLRVNRATMQVGGNRMYLLDEVHMMTKEAQNCLLNVLENPPSWVYFVLATTEPEKLLPTIKTRCSVVDLESVKEPMLKELVLGVLKEELGKHPDPKEWETTVDRIAEAAEGSPRKALNLLGQVMQLPNENLRLDAINKADSRFQAHELCRALLANKRWEDVKSIAGACEGEPEQIRRIILGYMTKVLLGGGKSSKRAAQIIQEFRGNFFDEGRAGLVVSAYNLCGG